MRPCYLRSNSHRHLPAKLFPFFFLIFVVPFSGDEFYFKGGLVLPRPGSLRRHVHLKFFFFRASPWLRSARVRHPVASVCRHFCVFATPPTKVVSHLDRPPNTDGPFLRTPEPCLPPLNEPSHFGNPIQTHILPPNRGLPLGTQTKSPRLSGLFLTVPHGLATGLTAPVACN